MRKTPGVKPATHERIAHLDESGDCCAARVNPGDDPLGVTTGKGQSEHIESASPPKAAVNAPGRNRRSVPKAAVSNRSKSAAYSITPSARERIEVGRSRPSALAVFRLMTSPYLVGACTGRSAGSRP